MFLSYLIYIVYATLRAADYLYVPRDARGGSAPATKLLDVPSPHPLNDAAINKLSAVVNAAPTVAHVPRDMVPDDFAGIEDLLAPTDAGSEGALLRRRGRRERAIERRLVLVGYGGLLWADCGWAMHSPPHTK